MIVSAIIGHARCTRLLRLHHGKRTERHALYRRDQQSNRRVFEHREGLFPGFTKRYGVKRLVYFEEFPTAFDAIHREKRIKKYPRAWKINLILGMNPDWRDLAETLNS